VKWCAALLLVAVLAGCSRDIPSDKPVPVLHAWVRVTGVSMSPTFPAERFVEVQVGFPYEQLKAGDTVIYWDYTAGNRLIHHRLVEEQFGAWMAKGDNPVTNQRVDAPWVTKDNYIARTTGRYAQILTP
jgi:signal peptidase I